MSKSTTLTGMCVLALILLSGAAMAAELQNGLLVVNSTPGGATIYVDGGNYRFYPFDNATTNSSIYLEPGCYDVYLEKYGYQIWDSGAYTDAICINDTDVINLETLIGHEINLTKLPDNTGTVIITSEPEPAKVFIPALVSGLPVGTTTYANGQIQVGTYAFHLDYPGYYPYDGTFTIKPGELTHVYAKMVRIPTTGFVDFRTDPTDAAIYLNGTDFKHTNQVIELEPGCYNYTFTHAGYISVNGTFCVTNSYQAENPLPIWRNLTKIPETQDVVINTTPNGARIFVDGNDTGKDTTEIVNLVRAFHTIVLKKPCYKDRVIDLDLTQLPVGLFPLDVVLDDLTVQMNCPGMQNGTIFPVGGPCVTYLQDKTYNVTAENGYHITEITFVNKTGTYTQPFPDGRTATYLYTLKNVSESGNLCAQFAINKYNVTAVVSPAGRGFIQVSSDPAWYNDKVTKFVDHGTPIVFKINNTDHYLFDRFTWNGNTTLLGGAKESYIFDAGPIVSDSELTVPFEKAEFYVAPLITGSGTVAPPGVQPAIMNGTVCFTATPGADYFIGNVTAFGHTDSNTTNLTPNGEGKYCVCNITQNYDVMFPFTPYLVVVNSSVNAGGVITASPQPLVNGNVTVPRNTTLTFNATPDDCHVLGSFTFNGNIVWGTNTTTVNVTQNSTIAAIFNPKTVEVTPVLIAPAGTSGATIQPSTKQTLYCGSSVVFNVTSPNCYHPNVTLSGPSGTTKPVGLEIDRNTWMYNLTNIREDKTFTVTFDIDQKSIYTTATGHGTITPLGTTTVPCGSNSTVFTITPESAAYDYSANVTGYAGGFPSDGVFRNVANNISVNVTFFPRASPLVDFAAMNYPVINPLSSGEHVVIKDTNPLNRTVKFFDMTDPSYNPKTWNWDFGDGRYSIEKNPVHTYEAVGTYTVSLTVGNGAMVPGYKQKIYYVIGDMRP